MKILLVEDEKGLVLTLTDRLQSENFTVVSISDGADGFQIASTEKFDLIILDVMLPGKNGFDICRDLRQKGIKTPILMLTAKGETFDKVLGLKIGADDYLTKPFEIAELLARIEALLRRATKDVYETKKIFKFGSVTADFRRGEVFKNGAPIELSAMEFKLLQYFTEHCGEVLSRHDLLDGVWGYNAIPSTRTVDVHVAWLRQKLEENPKYPQFFQTVHGFGYKFTV